MSVGRSVGRQQLLLLSISADIIKYYYYHILMSAAATVMLREELQLATPHNRSFRPTLSQLLLHELRPIVVSLQLGWKKNLGF